MPLPPPGAAGTAPSSAGSPPASTSRSTTSSCGPARRSRRARACSSPPPPGAGKTIVGEFAVHLALATGRKAFYTTPIKALSNQKYHDLVRVHGADKVGLLTGDSSVNGEAPVVVMTTEVLRNMMYAGSRTLDGLGLRRHGRGALPGRPVPRGGVGGGHHPPARARAGRVALGDGEQRRGVRRLARARCAATTRSSCPSTGRCRSSSTCWWAPRCSTCSPATGSTPTCSPAIRTSEQRGRWDDEPRREGVGRGGSGRGGPPARTPARPRPRPRRWRRGARVRARRAPRWGRDPRRGDRRARPRRAAARDHLHLQPGRLRGRRRASCSPPAPGSIPEREGLRIRRHVEERVESLADEDLSVLGYFDFVEGLSRGFAAHHAGMLPLFREIVEELFTAARIRAVFATETLALGINMPARTVVLEKLVKFNGEAHVDITPAEYTQLTGRAGRRGIDVEGHAVVQWARGVDPLGRRRARVDAHLPAALELPADLQHGRQPRRPGRPRGGPRDPRDLLRPVPGRPGGRRHRDRGAPQRGGAARATPRRCTATSATSASTPHCAARSRDAEKEGVKARSASRRAEAAVSLEALRIGDVIRIPAGRRAGWAVVVQPARTGKGTPAGPGVVTEDKQFRRLTLVDVPEPVEAVAHVKVPPHFNPKSPRSRRDLATSLRIAVPHGFEDSPRRRARRGHGRGDRAGRAAAPGAQVAPVPPVPRPRGARPLGRAVVAPASARPSGLQRKVEGRTNTVARTFDRICDALEARGYLADGGTVGHRARRAAAPAVHREGPARGRVPAPRRVEAARRTRAGRRGVGAGARAPARGGRGLAADAERRRRRGPHPDVAALVRDRGPRDRARPALHHDARRRDGVDGAPLGLGRAPRHRAARAGHGRR